MENENIQVIHPAFTAKNWDRNVTVFNGALNSNLYWITALSGELGEAAEIVKKLDRGFNARDLDKAKKKFSRINPGADLPDDDQLQKLWTETKKNGLASELADIFTYLDLFATANGINLSEAINNKFNEVNKGFKDGESNS